MLLLVVVVVMFLRHLVAEEVEVAEGEQEEDGEVCWCW